MIARPPTSDPPPLVQRGGILALLPFLVSGALSTVILRAMRERGLDVTVAFYFPSAVGYTPDHAGDFAADGRLLDMTRHWGPSGAATLEETVRQRNIGLVLQIGAPQAYPQLPILKRSCPDLQILDVLYNKVGHTLDHFLYERCFDGVVVESHDMRRYMLRNTAKADPRVHVVLSGIDLDRFRPAELVTSREALVIGYLGRMSPEKNPIGFVRLAERLHASFPSFAFRVFGEGPISAEVRTAIARSPASHAIRFEGFAESTAQALQGLDALVVPSILDGRPNVIMEANACGIPVFGAPVGGIPEMIEDGVNGYLLSPQDHERFAEIFQRWTVYPQDLTGMRAAARRTAEARFDKAVMLDAYEGVFLEAAACLAGQ